MKIFGDLVDGEARTTDAVAQGNRVPSRSDSVTKHDLHTGAAFSLTKLPWRIGGAPNCQAIMPSIRLSFE